MAKKLDMGKNRGCMACCSNFVELKCYSCLEKDINAIVAAEMAKKHPDEVKKITAPLHKEAEEYRKMIQEMHESELDLKYAIAMTCT